MKMLLETKICMHYWRNHVKSGCAIAGLHCISKRVGLVILTDASIRKFNDVKWRVSPWSREDDDGLRLEGDAVVVTQPGKFFVYGHITFYSMVKHESYKFLVNDQPWITCSVSQPQVWTDPGYGS